MKKKIVERKGLLLKKILWYPQAIVLAPLLFFLSAISTVCEWIIDVIREYNSWYFFGCVKRGRRR